MTWPTPVCEHLQMVGRTNLLKFSFFTKTGKLGFKEKCYFGTNKNSIINLFQWSCEWACK